uniref:RAP domain-containing protein n=1 Tax=Spongospora subterranea TaxID=70186 RepID=A0A0H5RAX8_9EUKA|eukprot:CRZ11330.1 hypothetical protein [Spongospora subterranea]
MGYISGLVPIARLASHRMVRRRSMAVASNCITNNGDPELPPMSHIVNKQIVACSENPNNLKGLLAKFRQNQTDLTAINAATSLFAIAKHGISNDAENTAWLISILKNNVLELRARELANVVWALPKIGCDYDNTFALDLAVHASNLIRHMSLPRFVGVMLGFAHLSVKSNIFWSQAAVEIKLRSRVTPSKSVANIFWALGSIQMDCANTALPAICVRSLALVNEFNGADIGSILWALNRLNVKHQALNAALIEEAVIKCDQLDDVSLVRVVKALAESPSIAGSTGSIFLESAKQRVHKLSWRHMVDMHAALSVFCQGSMGDWDKLLSARICKSIAQVPLQLFPNVVSALVSTSAEKPVEVVEQIAWRASTRMRELDIHQTASLISSLYLLNSSNIALFKNLSHKFNISDGWRALSVLELCNVGIALASMSSSDLGIRASVFSALQLHADKLRASEIAPFLQTLQKFGILPNEEIRRTCIDRISASENEVMPPSDYAYIVSQLAESLFDNKIKSMKVMSNRILNAAVDMAPSSLTKVMLAFRKTGLVDPKLCRTIHNVVETRHDEFSFTDLASLLSHLHELSQLDKSLVNRVMPFSKLQSMSLDDLSIVLHLLSTEGLLDRNLLQLFSERLALYDNDNSMAIDTKIRCCQIAAFSRYFPREDAGISLCTVRLVESWRNDIGKTLDKPAPSRFALQVSRKINELGVVHDLEHWIPSIAVYADIFIPQSNIVVEVDGPTHFIRSIDVPQCDQTLAKQLNQSTISRRRLIIAAGFKLITVNHDQWIQLSSQSGRKAWLDSVLRPLIPGKHRRG